MSAKRKISIRKIIQAVLTLVLAVVCITAVMSATRMQQSRKLNGVDINISNNKFGFVTGEEIESTLLRDGELGLGRTELSQLNVSQMEHVLKANPWVDDAEVYIDNNAKLHALVTQRVPAVRIFEKTGGSYYLDKNYEQLPLSFKYNHYSMVVTNVPELNNDSAGSALKERIMKVVDFIKHDTFWNAQVSQVIVRDDLNFEIVPVLGDQQIIIGDTTLLETKFNNLFTFYTKVLNEIGWDRYDKLDLSYKGQLVASPAIDWRLPHDKGIERINWVKTILGDTITYRPVSSPRPVSAAAKAKPAVEEPVEARAEPEAETANPDVEVQQRVEVKPEPPKKEKVETQPEPETKEIKKEDKKPKYIYGGNGN